VVFPLCGKLILTHPQVLENEPENEITITVFRLLVLDLLALFQVLNQAMINILGETARSNLLSPVQLLTP
jgi:hypothetical protein